MFYMVSLPIANTFLYINVSFAPLCHPFISHLFNFIIKVFTLTVQTAWGKHIHCIYKAVYSHVVFYKSQRLHVNAQTWFPLHWFSKLAMNGHRPASDRLLSVCSISLYAWQGNKCQNKKQDFTKCLLHCQCSQTTLELSLQSTGLAIYSTHSVINSSHVPEKQSSMVIFQSLSLKVRKGISNI